MTLATPHTIDDFYDHLGVPEGCLLGKRIYKKFFYEKGKLNATDKKAFKEDISNIEWRYTLQPTTINISRFEDENLEYLEIAIIHVTLTSGKRYKRIADTIQKTIPYPLLIVFSCAEENNEQLALNVGEKRINRTDSDKIVITEIYDTGWIGLTRQETWQHSFLKDFYITSFSFRNLYDFYQDMVNRIIALNCAKYTGRYALTPEDVHYKINRLDKLRNMEQLQHEQTELRNKLKKEKNMGTQVELNTRVKQISDRIETIKQTI